MRSNNKDLYEIYVIGKAGVGKSSVIRRYCKGFFLDDYKIHSSEEEFLSKTMELDNAHVSLNIYELSPEGIVEFMKEKTISTNTGFMLVYSVDDRDSLGQIPDLYRSLNGLYIQSISDRGERVSEDDDETTLAAILVGNKADLDEEKQVVTKEEAQELAVTKLQLSFFEVSAKLDENISDAFEELARLLQSRSQAQKTPRQASEPTSTATTVTSILRRFNSHQELKRSNSNCEIKRSYSTREVITSERTNVNSGKKKRHIIAKLIKKIRAKS
jgi:GTPase SAR1 family protein